MRAKVWMCLLGHRWEGVPFMRTVGAETKPECPCCHVERPDVRSPAVQVIPKPGEAAPSIAMKRRA